MALLFYGFPFVGVAGAAQAAFNCQHRACDMEWNGQGVEFYSAFVLILTVPLVWWQLLSLLTATVAVRSARAQAASLANGSKSKDDLPESKEQLDLQYPPLIREDPSLPAHMQADNRKPTLFFMTLSASKWLLQCVLLLALLELAARHPHHRRPPGVRMDQCRGRLVH